MSLAGFSTGISERKQPGGSIEVRHHNAIGTGIDIRMPLPRLHSHHKQQLTVRAPDSLTG